MENEKKFCPYKRQIEVDYRNGKRKMQEKFTRCSGSKCMAYKEGVCLRLEDAERKKAR